jgi:hypothetical protein
MGDRHKDSILDRNRVMRISMMYLTRFWLDWEDAFLLV